jgi:predicted kinase
MEGSILVFTGNDEKVREEIEHALRVQVRDHKIALVNASTVTRSDSDLNRAIGKALIHECSATIPTDNVQHLRKKLRIRY